LLPAGDRTEQRGFRPCALEASIHPKVVSERLGHSSVSITLDTYSHAIPAMQETAAALVAALFTDEEPLPEPPVASPGPTEELSGLSPLVVDDP